MLILDEAVSALDVSIQAQILNLLADLRREFRLTYILISHDLTVVRQVADQVLVVYRGRVVEVGPVETILSTPLPRVSRLLESVPRPGMALARRPARSTSRPRVSSARGAPRPRAVLRGAGAHRGRPLPRRPLLAPARRGSGGRKEGDRWLLRSWLPRRKGDLRSTRPVTRSTTACSVTARRLSSASTAGPGADHRYLTRLGELAGDGLQVLLYDQLGREVRRPRRSRPLGRPPLRRGAGNRSHRARARPRH